MSKIYVDNTRAIIDEKRKDKLYQTIRERVFGYDSILPEEYFKMRDAAFIYSKENDASIGETIKKTVSAILTDGMCDDEIYAKRVLTLCAANVGETSVEKYLSDAVNNLIVKAEQKESALLCDAFGSAAVYLNDNDATDKCIEITERIAAQYKEGKRQKNMKDVWEECTHIAHFNSVCLESGIELDKLNHKFYVDTVRWYTQNIYDFENLKWLRGECDGMCPWGDMLIHIASLEDDVIFRNMLRNKGLAMYLFEHTCEVKGAYGEFSYRNIDKSIKPYDTFEATLAEFDIFKNGDIIVRDEYPDTTDAVGILANGVMKYVSGNTHLVSELGNEYDKTIRAEIVGDCCVVITEKKEEKTKRVKMYILNLPSIVVMVDYTVSDVPQKIENVFECADNCASITSDNSIVLNKNGKTLTLTEAYLSCDGERNISKMIESFDENECKDIVSWRSLASERLAVYVAVADDESLAERQNVKEADDTISIIVGTKKQMVVNIKENFVTIIHQDGLRDEYTL